MVEIQARGILFDMDGTLVNTVECVEKWWRKLAAQHNIDADQLLLNIHGHPTYDVLCRWFPPSLHTRECAQQFEIDLMNDASGVYAVPGTHEVIRQLQPHQWVIVTAATETLALTRLAQVNLPAPLHLVTDKSVSRGKPHPECFQLGAQMLSISPADSVVFEDSVNGVKAAHAAGATVVGVLTSTSKEKLCEAGADYVIDDFTNICIKQFDNKLFISW
ncbi:DL-glycerol-3-phosphatase [Coemansia brasiliensis]|uniref:DL-glycerol-3-phosphatase n=1 Tax=Coemansia brasiliensis TaxID=2650707 RepID=A0A9W8I7Q9_9FUNG|nr:DL-glycerol-3-phosphatase [Coemansia brasiliensis]